MQYSKQSSAQKFERCSNSTHTHGRGRPIGLSLLKFSLMLTFLGMFFVPQLAVGQFVDCKNNNDDPPPQGAHPAPFPIIELSSKLSK